MKKQITLLSGLLLFAGAVVAQKHVSPTQMSKKAPVQLYTGKVVENTAVVATEKAPGDVLWQNNFNTNTNWLSTGVMGTPDATDYGWIVASAPNTEGSWYTSTSVNSTSDGGYAMVRNGDPTAGVPDPIANSEWILTYDSIFDFSAISNLSLQFQQSGARFIDRQVVEVSTDGGTNWIIVGGNDNVPPLTAGGGAAYTNPTNVTCNLSLALSQAGMTATNLKFRFRVFWDASAGANSGIMYAWFIDDVKFVEGFPNDLSLETVYNMTGVQEIAYTKFPVLQAVSGAVETSVSGVIQNQGSGSQDAIYSGTNGVYAESSATTPIAGFAKDSLVIDPSYIIPSVVGLNNFATVVTSGNNTLSNTTNDTRAIKFEVTDSVMAVDAYTGVASSITGSFTAFGSQAEGDLTGIGTYYEVFEDGQILGFDIGIANLTGAAQTPYIGREFYVTLAKFDGTDFVYDSETDAATLAATNFGKLVHFSLANPIDVVQGDLLLVLATATVGTGTTGGVPFAFSGLIPTQNLVGLVGSAIPDDLTGVIPEAATPTLNDAPVVRVVFNAPLGINEIADLSSVNAYPNPFNNSTSIAFELKNDANVGVVVTDLTGRTILTIDATDYAAGQHTIELNGAAFNAGVYNYTLTVGNNTITKRIVKK